MVRYRVGPQLGILGVVAFAAGLCGAWGYASAGASPADLARDLAVGWTFAAVGLVAWRRRPANGTGRLMVAEGVTWFIGNVQGTGIPVLVGVGVWLEALNLAVLAHLVLSFPDGRLTGRVARLTAVAGYGLVAVGGLARAVAYDPASGTSATYLSCDCTENALLFVRGPGVFDAIVVTYHVLGWLVTLACVAVVVRRWRAGTRSRRQALLPALLALAFAVVFVAWDVIFRAVAPAHLSLLLVVASDVSQTIVPLAFLAGLLRLRLRRAAVGSLVLDVGADPSPHRLRDALAGALGDPSLQLGLWRPEADRYADPDGLPLPSIAGAGRSVTHVASGGERSAVLLHDAALDDDRKLLSAVSASVRLVLDNAWLRSEVEAPSVLTPTINSRIVQAADRERRRLERDLHDGAQVQVVAALVALQRVNARLRRDADAELRETVAEAGEALRRALAELRDLAQGIHPAILTRDGLEAAVLALAELAPLPVIVSVRPGRYPPLIEATAYFTICEALTNAAKHARARAVCVTARRDGEWLIVEVTDDGVGGADDSRGTGLRGLADRIAAVGGVLRVVSPAAGGTQVMAELPCE